MMYKEKLQSLLDTVYKEIAAVPNTETKGEGTLQGITPIFIHPYYEWVRNDTMFFIHFRYASTILILNNTFEDIDEAAFEETCNMYNEDNVIVSYTRRNDFLFVAGRRPL